MRNRVIFYDWRIPKMPVLPRFMPIDANKVDWKNSSKILCMKDATRMSLYVCHHHPLWIADSGLWEGCLRCEGGGTEVWIWIWGQLLCSQKFPSRSGIYWAQLFICLFAFAFADCHSIECICFSAAAMSQGLCWIHFPLVSTTPYTHVYTYILFCLPKMTNRRCARTSPPPMRNKDQRLHFEWLSNTELLQLVFMSCLNNWSQP